MPPSIDQSIYRKTALCGGLLIAALIIPRFFPNSEGGFAAATNAVLVFLAILCVAGIVSIMLLVQTVRAYGSISLLARVLGLASGVIITTGLIAFWVFLRY